MNKWSGGAGEDNEIAARLYNCGIKRRNLKFAALTIHLYHRLRTTMCRLGIDRDLSDSVADATVAETRPG